MIIKRLGDLEKKTLESIRGKTSKSDGMIYSFMYMLTLTNPGSVVEVKTFDDCTFQYAYMAINASIKGWHIVDIL